MNKVFKVIWSEARNAYVVVSEIAKNHGSKSCSTKKLLTMLIATGVMTCASMAPAMAGNPAPDDLNVTIGNGAHISVWNGSTGQNINGDIAVGPNAHAWNGEYSYTDPFSKRVYPRIGSKEYLMDFGQGAVENVIDLSIKPHYKVVDGSKIAGSIAIGKNTIARTGSVMLGDHSYTGKLGDVEINPKDAMTYNDGIYSTTLGAGAYNSGSLAAVTGALSIASGKKDKDTQNTGATIYGSLNSIESATNDSNYSGVASSVLGFANRTQNANAALIWGTGNEVTNSIEDVKGIDFKKWSSQSVSDAQKDAIEAMQSSKYAGGSVLAIGGGNKADYAKYSQLTGVQNKVTGTKSENAKYDFVNGYQNIVKDASDVTVIGTKNEVTADGNKVIGDNHQVSGKNNVIFGSVKELTETTVNNAVVLGYNAKVTGEGGVVLGYNAKVTGKDGVALGAGSVADRANAVSVGSSVKGNKITRQIINVAEGTEDTDAVNVSQLRKATANANKGWKLSTEGGAENQVASEATVDFSGKKDAGNYQNITVSNEGNNVKFELANELHNVTGVVNEGSKLTLGNGVAGINNGTAQMAILNDGIYLSNLKAEQKGVQIHGVAAGTA
ncbi:ESPR-type extended signal peptide-containing protein, partial [uncultured Phascolarctobacterium sp.]|uniref:ESPR-type extended signal peptide-containing protein n=1 Tax=uncultured Phascolarctobacterium sp. TaxID=512296 RepID=UPI0025E8AFD0